MDQKIGIINADKSSDDNIFHVLSSLCTSNAISSFPFLSVTYYLSFFYLVSLLSSVPLPPLSPVGFEIILNCYLLLSSCSSSEYHFVLVLSLKNPHAWSVGEFLVMSAEGQHEIEQVTDKSHMKIKHNKNTNQSFPAPLIFWDLVV